MYSFEATGRWNFRCRRRIIANEMCKCSGLCRDYLRRLSSRPSRNFDLVYDAHDKNCFEILTQLWLIYHCDQDFFLCWPLEDSLKKSKVTPPNFNRIDLQTSPWLTMQISLDLSLFPLNNQNLADKKKENISRENIWIKKTEIYSSELRSLLSFSQKCLNQLFMPDPGDKFSSDECRASSTPPKECQQKQSRRSRNGFTKINSFGERMTDKSGPRTFSRHNSNSGCSGLINLSR